MSSDDSRIAFINAVHERPALWDHKHKSHHNRYVLDKLWDEVAADCNIGKQDARKKWKNIRDKFRVELQKVTESRSNAGAEDLTTSIKIEPEEESTWPLFGHLQFLRDQFLSRENGNNHEENNDSSHEVPIYYPTTEFDPLKADWHSDSISSSSTSESVQRLIDRFSPTSSTSHGEAVRKLESTVEELQQKVKELEDFKARLTEDDASSGDLSFFKSLLPHIAKLEDKQRMSLMMDIQRCVYERVYWAPDAPDCQEGPATDPEADPLQISQKAGSSTKRKKTSTTR